MRDHPLTLSRYVRDFYQISLLDSGGFGDVYRASHRLDGVDYAVKRVSFAEDGYSDKAVRTVLREVECLAAVSGHPHCVRYYGGWLEPGWMTGEGTGDGVEAAALPAPLTGIVGNGGRDGFDPGPGRRLLQDANADAFRGAGR